MHIDPFVQSNRRYSSLVKAIDSLSSDGAIVNFSSNAFPVTRESLSRITSLAPFGGLLVLTYLVLGVICAYDAFLEYEFNMGREPARVPYLMTIYASLESLLAMSAFRTGQAAMLFHRLRHQPTPDTLDAALLRVRDMLLLFFVWTSFAIASYAWFRFHPA